MTSLEITTISSPASTITLPAERLEQLRMIAARRGVTLVGLLESVIAEAIDYDEIPDTLPTFDVHAHDDHVVIDMRGWVLPMLRREQAIMVAHGLEAAAGKTPLVLDTGVMMPVGRVVGFAIREGDALHELTFGRHGRGVSIGFRNKITGEATKTALSPSIAVDLARIIRNQAATMIVRPSDLEQELEAGAVHS
ncbi:hypothetical protein SAMN02799631_01052 [Methylobacterium sp. 174MFSha1.1]|uniref:hypothetical protein n=1 Tax=Methylobacterium sp. 174MFSha1.1 TaxID=1502749 RepID=UPI0008E6B37E|nr:hypothetical protein [Methylobacterium sp. 174MFSha1.1]SFU53561.1 hypothetical protein SAMN02799631_01052 [Methylobacterium sp. 174MFSha1.1]